jgi:hypothetical protein
MGTEERTGGSTASQTSRLDLGIDLFKVGFRGGGQYCVPDLKIGLRDRLIQGRV